MNLVDLLTLEHAALRVHFGYFYQGRAEKLYEVAEFVISCHARVEDAVVFPGLRQLLSRRGIGKGLQALDRLSADHKMISTLYENLRKWTVEGEAELVSKRGLMFAQITQSHNTNEEILIFPYWSGLDKEERSAALELTKSIIKEYGLERYYAVTGISSSAFEHVDED